MKIKQVEVEIILPLRQKVLRPGKSIEESRLPKDQDKNTFHLALFKENRVVGVATFMSMVSKPFKVKNQYRLRGMAVDPAFRNQNLGKALFTKGIELLKEKDIPYLWFDARFGAVEFYKKQGCQVYGEQFLVPEIGPHHYMYINL